MSRIIFGNYAQWLHSNKLISEGFLSLAYTFAQSLTNFQALFSLLRVNSLAILI